MFVSTLDSIKLIKNEIFLFVYTLYMYQSFPTFMENFFCVCVVKNENSSDKPGKYFT